VTVKEMIDEMVTKMELNNAKLKELDKQLKELNPVRESDKRLVKEVYIFSTIMLSRLNNTRNKHKPHYLDVSDSELMAHLLDEVRELREATDSRNKKHELVDLACMAMLCYWAEANKDEVENESNSRI